MFVAVIVVAHAQALLRKLLRPPGTLVQTKGLKAMMKAGGEALKSSRMLSRVYRVGKTINTAATAQAPPSESVGPQAQAGLIEEKT